MVPGKGLEPLMAGLQGAVVQGGVGIVGSTAQAGGPLEQGVVLIYVVVDDLTAAPQGLHRPLRGVGLQHGAVVMDMIKGQQSCLQQRVFLSAVEMARRSGSLPVQNGVGIPGGQKVVLRHPVGHVHHVERRGGPADHHLF